MDGGAPLGNTGGKAVQAGYTITGEPHMCFLQTQHGLHENKSEIAIRPY